MSDLENKESMSSLTLPTMALRGLTVFPSMLLHFDVGRAVSIQALDQAVELGSYIFLVPQKRVGCRRSGLKDLYAIGTIAAVRQVLGCPETTSVSWWKASREPVRWNAGRISPIWSCRWNRLRKTKRNTTLPGREAVIRTTYELIEHYCELSTKVSSDIMLTVMGSQKPGYMADYIAQNISIRGEDKQAILEELRPLRRLEKMNQILRKEIRVLEIEKDMETKIRDHMNEAQKDYYLREQLKVIQNELGETNDADDEIKEYEQKIKTAKLPEEVEGKLKKSCAG